MKVLNLLALVVCLLLSSLTFLSSQEIDLEFGSNGFLEVDIPSIFSINEVDNHLLINNLTEIHSFTLEGLTEHSFGLDGVVEKPFDSDSALILRSFIFNGYFTIMGCKMNASFKTDLAVQQLDVTTGEGLPHFQLSSTEKPLEDEFVSFQVIGNELVVAGYEVKEASSNYKEYNPLLAYIDKNGKIAGPLEQISVVDDTEEYKLQYHDRLLLKNGKTVHFFGSGYDDNYYLITEKYEDVRDIELESRLVRLSYFGKGIQETYELSPEKILIKWNNGCFSQGYELATLLDLANNTLAYDILENIGDEYFVNDVVVRDNQDILVVGTKDKEGMNTTGFVCLLNSDFVVDEGFGQSGFFEFALDEYNLSDLKAFEQGSSLYVSTVGTKNNNLKSNFVSKIFVEKEDVVQPDPADENTISYVYPNPFSNNLYMKMESAMQIQEIELIDALGNRIETVDRIQSLKTDNLADGIYFLRLVFMDSSQKTVKIIKSNY